MKKIIFTLAAAALMASCAKTEMNDPAAEGEGAWIQARSKHNGVTAAVTRKPFEGPIASGTNELTARILTYREDNTLWSDGTMTFTDDNTTPVVYTTATNKKFGADLTETYTMYGFYPATGWTATAPDPSSGTMVYTFTGKEDVMIAPGATTTPGGQQGTTPIIPTLTFGHQLTKLIIQINAEDAEAGTEWGKLSDIKVIKLANAATNLTPEASYVPSTGAITFGGTPLSSFGFYNYDGTDYLDTDYNGSAEIAFNTDNTTFTTVAYTMVPPFIISGTNDVVLEVKAETSLGGSGSPRTIEVPVELTIASSPANTAGYAFTIKLTFDMQGIQAKATVTAWQDGDVVPPVTVQ